MLRETSAEKLCRTSKLSAAPRRDSAKKPQVGLREAHQRPHRAEVLKGALRFTALLMHPPQRLQSDREMLASCGGMETVTTEQGIYYSYCHTPRTLEEENCLREQNLPSAEKLLKNRPRGARNESVFYVSGECKRTRRAHIGNPFLNSTDSFGKDAEALRMRILDPRCPNRKAT